jgi:hypothetical protein
MGLVGWGGLELMVKYLFISGEGFDAVHAEQAVEPLAKVLV